jgi:N-acetylneuraminate synthase
MLEDDIVKRVVKRAESLGLAIIATHYSEADLRSSLALKATAHGLAYPIIIDQALVSKAAATRKPLLVSTEACELPEIETAYAAARSAGGEHMAILHHVGGEAGGSANLHTILDMSFRFDTAIGLTDRSKGTTAAIAAVALGASIVAKPLSLESENAPKGALGAEEFAELTVAGKTAWKSLGLITYGLSDAEKATRAQRAGDGQLLAG